MGGEGLNSLHQVLSQMNIMSGEIDHQRKGEREGEGKRFRPRNTRHRGGVWRKNP